MYTILPVYQDKMPASYVFETVEDATAGAIKDFEDPYTPETKGFMIVKLESAIGVDRSINQEVDLTSFIEVKEEAETSPEEA